MEEAARAEGEASLDQSTMEGLPVYSGKSDVSFPPSSQSISPLPSSPGLEAPSWRITELLLKCF